VKPDFSYIADQSAIAVAVSGGGDSMALAHMLSRQYPDKRFHAITVDHGLRAESAAEAVQVGAWLAGLSNVTHIILRWEGDKPQTRRMEAARDARYRLMVDYCRAHDLKILALAHHGDDQAETFFMRLVRGSGLDGLAGMRTTRTHGGALTLWRPLLKMRHSDLIEYCQTQGVNWVEDPTNNNPAYTRTRFRQLAGLLRDEGLSAARMAVTASRLARAQDALHELAGRLAAQARIDADDDRHVYDLNRLKGEPFELGVRVLKNAIDALGTGSARFDKIETVAQACLLNDADTRATLGGCIVETDCRRGTLRVRKEIP